MWIDEAPDSWLPHLHRFLKECAVKEGPQNRFLKTDDAATTAARTTFFGSHGSESMPLQNSWANLSSGAALLVSVHGGTSKW